jgi:hypothetical protein
MTLLSLLPDENTSDNFVISWRHNISLSFFPSLMLLMLVSSFPSDVWTSILMFLELADLSTLFSTNKKSHSTQDFILKQFALSKFPFLLLDISVYKNSWKKLLQDHNSKNGIYQLQLNTVSCSLRNTPHSFYVSMLRSIAWDRRNNRVILEVEAFGEDDLMEAKGTTIYRGARHRIKPLCVNYDSNGPSHKPCRLYLPEEFFLPSCKYTFSYGSSASAERDYGRCTFLPLPNRSFHSLPKLFALRPPCDLQVQSKRKRAAELLPPGRSAAPGQCRFVSPGTLLAPSNVLKWKGVSLPPEILKRHLLGDWGSVQQPTSTSLHNDNYENMNTLGLKAALRKKNLFLGGKKAQLIQRLQASDL